MKKGGTEAPERENAKTIRVLKKPYEMPEIARIKMQPEQAVLSCCVSFIDQKTHGSGEANLCGQPTGAGGSPLGSGPNPCRFDPPCSSNMANPATVCYNFDLFAATT